MGIDHVRTVMELHRCVEAARGRTAILEGFMSYIFEACEVIGSEAETIPKNKRVGGNEDALTSPTPAAVPAYFCSGILRVVFEAVRWD